MALQQDDPKKQIKLIVAGVVFLAALVVAWLMVGGKTAADVSAERVYICSETGKSFRHTIKLGESEPIYSPHSKKKTGYAAEACYWRKMPDGTYKAKRDPTYVLVKKRVDPETTEKTFCPDCGHEVVGHNPMPPPELMKEAAGSTGK